MDYSTFLLDVLTRAGDVYYELRRQGVRGEIKGKGEVVSEMDRQISDLISAKLLEAGRSDILVLDEEKAVGLTPTDFRNARHILVVDPIDGSGAAVEGRAECCIMLGFFTNNGDGTFKGDASGFYRPVTREMCVYSTETGVDFWEQFGTDAEIYSHGHDAVNPNPPGNMLFDYRFYKEQFVWSEKVKSHLNPSGFNMGDVALNRGLGFVFVYKPWDLVCLPIVLALGCESYFLEPQDGKFKAIPSGDFSLEWFDFDETEKVFGKIKKPLLIARPANLAYILENLTPKS